MIFIYKELVKNYIPLLKPEDIKNFAFSKNIVLNDKEVLIIYNFIKKYYLELLDKNTSSFVILKNNLNSDLYNKCIDLYKEYENKYL